MWSVLRGTRTYDTNSEERILVSTIESTSSSYPIQSINPSVPPPPVSPAASPVYPSPYLGSTGYEPKSRLLPASSKRSGDGGSGNGALPPAVAFDGKVEHFPIWTKMFAAWLESIRCFWVLESDVVPADMVDKHRSVSMRVYSFIMQAIPMEIRMVTQHIDAGKAFALWAAINSHFNRSTMASQHLCRSKLAQIRLGKDESIASYVSRIRTLASSLAGMKTPMPIEMLQYHMTYGLPPPTLHSSTASSLSTSTSIRCISVCWITRRRCD